MLLGLGPFRFTVPTFSVEDLSRRTQGRIAQQDVIDRAPLTHLFGPAARSITLTSTFHPLHLNRAGGAMLDLIHLAAEQQSVLPLIAIYGRVFGLFVIESVDGRHLQFAPNGRAQTVEASMTLGGYTG